MSALLLDNAVQGEQRSSLALAVVRSGLGSCPIWICRSRRIRDRMLVQTSLGGVPLVHHHDRCLQPRRVRQQLCSRLQVPLDTPAWDADRT